MSSDAIQYTDKKEIMLQLEYIDMIIDMMKKRGKPITDLELEQTQLLELLKKLET